MKFTCLWNYYSARGERFKKFSKVTTMMPLGLSWLEVWRLQMLNRKLHDKVRYRVLPDEMWDDPVFAVWGTKSEDVSASLFHDFPSSFQLCGCARLTWCTGNRRYQDVVLSGRLASGLCGGCLFVLNHYETIRKQLFISLIHRLSGSCLPLRTNWDNPKEASWSQYFEVRHSRRS